MTPSASRVLLTGSTGGIGSAMARSLLGAGASVMLVGRNGIRLQAQMAALAGDCDLADRRLAWQSADLGADEDLASLRDAAIGWRCNVIVHCAGVPAFGRLSSLKRTDLQRAIEVNLLAPMLLTQALLPHLLGLPSAQVICVGSALGRIGLPGFSVYSASKFGLRGFAESLRRELADTGVKVQYLGPRSTQTDFNSASVEAYNRAVGAAMDPPERVAHALLELLSNERPEHFIGFPEALAVRLNGFAGPLLDGAFAKHRALLPPHGH